MLPSGSHVEKAPWDSYNEVKAAFDVIELNKTTKQDLKDLNFDPLSQPNIQIMSYLEVMQQFLVNPSIRKEDLDEGLQACIKAKTDCIAYKVGINNTSYHRYGNFFMDFLSFKRNTQMEGWKFNAIIVLIHDVVVYKLSSGTPNVNVNDVAVKPLGPAQNIGESPPTPPVVP
jgi:hypothetical protein